MYPKLSLIAVALACGSAFAQAPAGTTSRPSQEISPNQSGGVAQERAGMRNDAHAGMMMDHSAMDANKDGKVSQKEWSKYHNDMWRSMKPDKSGHVRWSDVNTRMMGGPGGPVGGTGGQPGMNQGGTPK